jgi:hypothetical protein
MNIKETFLNLTKHTVPYKKELEYLSDVLPMSILKKDPVGNLYIKIGNSNTMFASHLDTVGGDTEVVHEFSGDKIKTDGKSVLGADDKAGVTVMLYMIHQGVPGLYTFFMGEEVGCHGSKDLSDWIEKNKDDERYKDINKVVSFDRKDYDSVITYQMSERTCSDEFADSLIKELNKHDGLNFRKDTGGVLTDSVNFTDIYSECTNLSVGYFNQHMNSESQDIVWLEKFANACTKIDWENLTIKRKPGEVERLYKSYGGRGGGWNWEDDYDYGYNYNRGGTGTGAGFRSTSRGSSKSGTQKDWRGDEIPATDAVWCEYDNVWCHRDEAVWVDLLGFYTPPDEGTPKKYSDPKPTYQSTGSLNIEEWEKSSGKVVRNISELKVGDRVIHPSLGKGKINMLGEDGKKVSINLDDGKTKVFLIQVARIKKETE